MSVWQDAAIQLDDLYSQDPTVARRQIKNQPQLLVLDGTRHRFFPIRRLADGIAGRKMNAQKSQAQEVQRYRHSLKSSGFREITEGEAEYTELLGDLVSLLRESFQERPSPSKKTFWVRDSIIREAILDAFLQYDEHGMPDGFGEARTWFVSHPITELPYPAKVIWGLATNKKGSEFISHRARDGLRKAGFECADLGNLVEPELLREGSIRETTNVRRERNPVARVLCIEHYRKKNDGRLICIVCGFDFAAFYGTLGEGFIHVHHLNPISEAEASRIVSPEIDLVPVCPNCHSMIHRGGQTRSIAEMREILG
ncbi:HNH endonuclease [Roseobacter litoralis]|uniref:HNH endonuclease-like protein n=1 Tax=Roseobacter litoralis (strain ATCC 49566 / DSM 6996 / JCM 21268 / NBRC 15278 / OCh 149) TaxID=391595 RepID=F7ZG44_ROSLO|nr:HNH endonuclease [Roseobacter litoralis]AEI94775.1 HNH endonuclease-like protein [Roseobacter litoralis Och 149]